MSRRDLGFVLEIKENFGGEIMETLVVEKARNLQAGLYTT